jgi:5'-3' exonuclease
LAHHSGADVPGEGELKLLDWIHCRVPAGSDESVVIVGGDADLVLQGLAITKVLLHLSYLASAAQ